MRILLVILCSVLSAAAADRPNFVFILADDLGYMDIGANNPSTFYETPNIDSLAKSGMRFTDGHSACCVCSPTRGSIMTGKYPPRFGITDFIPGMRSALLKSAPNATFLPLEEKTIAETLRDAGYANFFAGKWHLGSGDYTPNAQGFGPGLVQNIAANGKSNGQFYYPPGNEPPPDHRDDPKTTDRIANEAVKFIAAHKDKPFFAYLPFLAVHTPIGARSDLVAKYQAKAKTAPADLFLPERDSMARQVQNNPVYAAMLEQMDTAVGRVLAALDSAGVREKTVVVFTSDNGGLSTKEGSPTSNVPLRGGKGWPYEGGIRTAWIVSAPGITKPGSTSDVPVITTDFYPTFLELAGLPAMPQQHLDGVTLVPVLKGGELSPRPLFWHYPHYGNQGGRPHGVIREGNWKLIEWFEDGSLELYDVPNDLSEKTNLAIQDPDRVKAMHAKLVAWRKEVGALMPTVNPDYKPGTETKASASKRKGKGEAKGR